MYDAVIIGGGAVGCAVARYLSRYRLSICLVERGEDVCVGTSKANSAICHAGFDAPVGSAKARFNVEGSRMMEGLSQELDFPYRRCGSLVLCFDEAELPHLRELLERGVQNGVEGLEILDRAALRALEPAVSDKAVAALWAPTGAVLCPFGMTIALAENAAANGCAFRFNTEVARIERRDGFFRLHTGGDCIDTRVVISAAGVYGDALHNQLCADKLTIVPRRVNTVCWTAPAASWCSIPSSSCPPPWARVCWSRPRYTATCWLGLPPWISRTRIAPPPRRRGCAPWRRRRPRAWRTCPCGT